MEKFEVSGSNVEFINGVMVVYSKDRMSESHVFSDGSIIHQAITSTGSRILFDDSD